MLFFRNIIKKKSYIGLFVDEGGGWEAAFAIINPVFTVLVDLTFRFKLDLNPALKGRNVIISYQLFGSLQEN